MSEQPTIAARIESLQQAVRGWLHLYRYSYHARSRRLLFNDREAGSDTKEILRDYGHYADDPHGHGIDPETKQEWYIDQYRDLRDTLAVEEVLKEHGWDVAAWLVQQNVRNHGTVALFLEARSRSPEVAESADKVLTEARAYALAEAPNGGSRETPEPPKLDASHSDDFRTVRWFGTEHTFSPMQAACVRGL